MKTLTWAEVIHLVGIVPELNGRTMKQDLAAKQTNC